MSKRQKLNASSSSGEVDFVRLCEDIVQRIQEVLNRGQVLHPRQCSSFASKLSYHIVHIREAVEGCGRYKAAFVPLLAALHRYHEKAEVHVNQCAQEDWCAAAVFLYRNARSIPYILAHIKTVGMKILELAKKYSADSTTTPHEFSWDGGDLNYLGCSEDVSEMKKRLEVLAYEWSKSSAKIFGFFLAQQAGLRQQHLAQYLLSKGDLIYDPLDALKIMMWENKKEPAGTWGNSKFLGEGNGANGVWKTSWLGVPCAKKEFHGEASEIMFLKEALIMARMKKHPCVVDFICCGNGEGKRERFIAMELMRRVCLT